MTRLLLALLAVMALLVSPVSATATKVACGHDGSAAMAGMDMSAMPGSAHAGAQKAMGDPCCDHSGQHKLNDKSCAQACAASCVATVALPTSLVGFTHKYTRARLSLARLVSVEGHEPTGPERPPKSIA